MTTDRKTHGQTLTDRTTLYVMATDVEVEVQPTCVAHATTTIYTKGSSA